MKKSNQLIVFVLFLFVALLVSCEKEQPNEKEPTKLAEEKTIVEKVTIEQLKQETVKTTIFDNISENLDISLDKFSKRGVEDRITILTDRILKVEKDSVITYSFMIEKPTSVSSDIENLMIFKYPNDTYRFLIVSYKYTGDETNPFLVSTKEIKSDDLKKVRYSKFVARRPELPFKVDDCVRVLIKQCKDAFANGNKIHGSAVCGNPPGSGPGTIIILDFSGCFDGGGKFDINSPGLNPKNKWHINLTPTSSGTAKSYVSNSSIINNKVVSGGAGAAVLCMDTPDGCIRQYDIEIEYLMGIKDAKILNYLKENRGFAERILKFYEKHDETDDAKRYVIEAIKVKMEKFDAEIDFDIEPIVTPKSRAERIKTIKKMLPYLLRRGSRDFGEYIESLLPSFEFFTDNEIKDIYELVEKQYKDLKFQYLKAILGAVIESTELLYPFIEYAILDGTLKVATPLLRKIPLSFVMRGARLEKMVRKIAKMGQAGTSSRIRIIRNGNYTKSFDLFKKLSKDAKNIKIETLSDGKMRRIADMGDGNFITFRNYDYSNTPNLVATIDMNFPKIWSKTRELKFIK